MRDRSKDPHTPGCIRITAGILGLFAVVPGFPTVIFLILGSGCAFTAFIVTRNRKRSATSQRSKEMPSLAPALAPKGTTPSFPDDDQDGGPVEAVSFALTVPLIVDIAASVRNSIRPE